MPCLPLPIIRLPGRRSGPAEPRSISLRLRNAWLHGVKKSSTLTFEDPPAVLSRISKRLFPKRPESILTLPPGPAAGRLNSPSPDCRYTCPTESATGPFPDIQIPPFLPPPVGLHTVLKARV